MCPPVLLVYTNYSVWMSVEKNLCTCQRTNWDSNPPEATLTLLCCRKMSSKLWGSKMLASADQHLFSHPQCVRLSSSSQFFTFLKNHHFARVRSFAPVFHADSD